jgi:hypothetical protein
MQGSARGTALVLLVVALPVLLLSIHRSLNKPGRALFVWGGALLFAIYNAVLFLFLTPFNAAFLVYVLMLASAVWSLGSLLVSEAPWRVAREVATRASLTAVAAYTLCVVVLNTAAWLSKVLPALDDPHPSPLVDGTGVATNAIYVQDLALWLPLAAVGAIWLRRRQAKGVVVVAPVLVMWVIEALSIAVDQWFGSSADPSSAVVSSQVVIPFFVIAIVGMVPVYALLGPGRKPRRPLQQ